MKEIITNTERITLDETGVVRCKAFKNSLLSLTDAKENIQAVKLLAKGKKVPVFVDITETKGGTKEARSYLASAEVALVQSACALLVSSPLSQLIGNFFLGLNRTKFPTRLFNDENKAMEWLKTFL
jgi:hypothetical protein